MKIQLKKEKEKKGSAKEVQELRTLLPVFIERNG